MGKKGSWFAAVKRVWSYDSKKKDKAQETRDVENEKKANLESQNAETDLLVNPIISSMETEDEQSRRAYSVAVATAMAAEAAAAAAQAAAEVARLTAASRNSSKSKEEMAAIKIQAALRGYMVRRGFKGLRGLVRLRSRIGTRSVKRQAITTLRCMQTIARVQSEVRARRIRLSEENQALQRQHQEKREKEIEKAKVHESGENFDVSTRSKEQIKAKIEKREEAAKRRERALAYAYTHQMSGRNSLTSMNQTFMDPYNPQWSWSWSWLERWMATTPTRPWENTIAFDKEISGKSSDKQLIHGPNPFKTTPKGNAKSSDKSDPKVNVISPNLQRFTPNTKPIDGRLQKQLISTGSSSNVNDDSRNCKNRVNSGHRRRHSNVEISDVPSFMAPTKARSRWRVQCCAQTRNVEQLRRENQVVQRRSSIPVEPQEGILLPPPPLYNLLVN